MFKFSLAKSIFYLIFCFTRFPQAEMVSKNQSESVNQNPQYFSQKTYTKIDTDFNEKLLEYKELINEKEIILGRISQLQKETINFMEESRLLRKKRSELHSEKNKISKEKTNNSNQEIENEILIFNQKINELDLKASFLNQETSRQNAAIKINENKIQLTENWLLKNSLNTSKLNEPENIVIDIYDSKIINHPEAKNRYIAERNKLLKKLKNN